MEDVRERKPERFTCKTLTMTVPHNTKLWLLSLPGHPHIVDDIVDLMAKCNVRIHSSGLNAVNAAIYIGVGQYDMSSTRNRDNFERTDVFKSIPKTEISLEDLFPVPELNNKAAIRVRNEAHSKAIQDALFMLGYGWGSVGKSQYANVNDPYIIMDRSCKRITCTTTQHGYTGIYYSQLLNIKSDGTKQVKVQGTHQPEPGCQGRGPVKLQSRQCKIATGERYTGHTASYRRGRATVYNSIIRGTVCVADYPGRPREDPRSSGRSQPTGEVKIRTVLGNGTTCYEITEHLRENYPATYRSIINSLT